MKTGGSICAVRFYSPHINNEENKKMDAVREDSTIVFYNLMISSITLRKWERLKPTLSQNTWLYH